MFSSVFKSQCLCLAFTKALALRIVSVESLWSMEINQDVSGVIQVSYCKSLCSGEMNCVLKTHTFLFLALEGVHIRCHLWMSAPVSPHCKNMVLSRLGLRRWTHLDFLSPEDSGGLLRSMSYSMLLGKQHGWQVTRKASFGGQMCKKVA